MKQCLLEDFNPRQIRVGVLRRVGLVNDFSMSDEWGSVQLKFGDGLDRWIRSLRPDLSKQRKALPVDKPALWLEEVEPDLEGILRRCLTVFLTNRECPWRCLMCDLWKSTSLDTLPIGSIPRQLEYALAGMGLLEWIKLYNAGSFFDSAAIPVADHANIAKQVGGFKKVIVECHPKLVGRRVVEFRDKLSGPTMEVAMGLETAQPEILSRLNKQMTLDDFARASGFLRNQQIEVRAFILIKPPFQSDDAALEWAVRSAQFAFDAGATTVSLIPTRGGEGALAQLEKMGQFSEPSMFLVEKVFDQVMEMNRGRVFIDLWDLERFKDSTPNFDLRKQRLVRMNHTQRVMENLS